VATASRSALVATATVAVAAAFAGPAFADEVQPGLSTTTPGQPGLSTTAPTAPVEPEGGFIPGYTSSPDVQWQSPRTVDDYKQGRQQRSVQPAYYEDTTPSAPPTVQAPPALQAAPEPPPVPTVQRTRIAPIETPEGNYILVGADPVPYDPNLLDPRLARQISNTGQDLQARGGNWLVDNGFADAPRADRIAAGTATGAVVGGVTGFGLALGPAAGITVGGAAIGGLAGLAATTAATPAVIFAGPLGYIFVPGAAALAGAGVGAAISTPLVLGSTAAGAVVGGLIGAGLAGGQAETITEPAPAPAVVPPAADSVPTIPPAATVDLPGAVGQVRDTLAADPNGRQVLAAADTAAANAAPIVDKAVDDASVWAAPAVEAAQGFTSKALEQPAVAQTVAAAQSAAAPVLDQANKAVSDALAAFAPAAA